MSSLIDNIEIVYFQPELDYSFRPKKPTEWELYLQKRYNELSEWNKSYHKYFLILDRIKNIVKSGKGITDSKVKYLFGSKWDL